MIRLKQYLLCPLLTKNIKRKCHNGICRVIKTVENSSLHTTNNQNGKVTIRIVTISLDRSHFWHQNVTRYKTKGRTGKQIGGSYVLLSWSDPHVAQPPVDSLAVRCWIYWRQMSPFKYALGLLCKTTLPDLTRQPIDVNATWGGGECYITLSKFPTQIVKSRPRGHLF